MSRRTVTVIHKQTFVLPTFENQNQLMLIGFFPKLVYLVIILNYFPYKEKTL